MCGSRFVLENWLSWVVCCNFLGGLKKCGGFILNLMIEGCCFWVNCCCLLMIRLYVWLNERFGCLFFFWFIFMVILMLIILFLILVRIGFILLIYIVFGIWIMCKMFWFLWFLIIVFRCLILKCVIVL